MLMLTDLWMNLELCFKVCDWITSILWNTIFIKCTAVLKFRETLLLGSNIGLKTLRSKSFKNWMWMLMVRRLCMQRILGDWSHAIAFSEVIALLHFQLHKIVKFFRFTEYSFKTWHCFHFWMSALNLK